LQRLREHPSAVTLLAFAIAGATVAAIAAAYGFGAFARAWSHPHRGWLALAIVAQLLSIPSYVISYRVLARFDGGPRLATPLVLRIVVAGFGPSAVGGGFALDRHALRALGGDGRAATTRVLGLGALEWAVLAPAAWLSAVVLLVTGDPRPMASLIWPWVVAVPIGFALGLWLATPRWRERLSSGRGRWRAPLTRTLAGVAILPSLVSGFSRCWLAWAGTALYWVLDIAAFYGCVRFVGLHPNIGETVLAYATGYALTRRSMPLGGAGVTEAFMTFALHWAGHPVAPALAAVALYRLLNLVVPALPALLVRRRVYPLVSAGVEECTVAPAERRRAAAPFRQLLR
jgi:uncharacterized membrane protein YbhN (UPF0104 family)